MKREGFGFFGWLAVCIVGSSLLVFPGHTGAQSLYYAQAAGRPTFNTPDPVEMGFTNVANGDLHLEIPLGSYTQRGSLTFTPRLVYDARIWEIADNGTDQSWQPYNLPNLGFAAFSTGGWNLLYSDQVGTASWFNSVQSCNPNQYTWYYGPFIWMAPDGTIKYYPINTQQDDGCGNPNVPSGSAYDQQSTGTHTTVTAYSNPVVTANNGSLIATGSGYPAGDSNGNQITMDSNADPIDTLNRTPVTVTNSGNTYYYTVLNSNGSTSQYTVTYADINVATFFEVPGVAEYSGTIRVITSISLPDGTSYSFTYDSGTNRNYGLMTSMTMRTGGAVTYTWTNFKDSYGNTVRWLASRASGGGTWTYAPSVITSCSAKQVGCEQQVTETKPSGDEAIYTFTLNNGAWNTETDYYSGSSSLLKKMVTSYDFSNACSDCAFGNAYIRPTQVVTTTPSAGSTLQSQTAYGYDSIYYGNVTADKEWNYTTGGFGATPDRETDYTYLNSSPYISANILNRVTDKVIYQTGSKVAETQTSYDSNALTATSGITHHDDTNYGTGNTVRGNPTAVSQWVGGSTYLNTTNYYDTTGQLVKSTDPAGNNTTYSYADNFYTDSSSNSPAGYTPSAPTNAYLTQKTLPVSGALKYGYYFGTGQQALSSDQNSQTTYQHYLDPLNRPTESYFPDGGWKLTNYTSATQTDVYTGITSTSPSISCSSCRHDEISYDGLGRQITQELVSDPDGPTTVSTSYDTSGRVSAKSNPYRSFSDPTYGVETYSYDGLDRQTSDEHADGNAVATYYGANVSGGGGIGTPLCSSGTYGYGYPTLTVDEAGHLSEIWTDAFGRNIETDEPDSTGALTLGTCYKYDALNDLTEVDQGSQTRTYSFDGLSREISETTPEAGTVNYYFTASGGGVCAGDSKQVCRRTDARGISTTYAYDAESRLTSKTYSDSTPAAYYYYDESSVTVAGTAYAIVNGKGRLTHTSAYGGDSLTIHSYDAMGRMTDFWQCANYWCTTTSLWDPHFTYDLAGGVTTWSHPDGFTVTNTISNAQRITAISSTMNNSTHPGTLAASITYAPQGAVAKLLDGCAGTGCTQVQETYDYNNRLQNVRIQLGTSSNNSSIACAVYNYYGSVANPSSCAIPSQGNSDDGDVLGQYDNDSANSSLSHTTSMAYDPTHRLTNSVAMGNSTYNLTFGYDRYGNMTCVQNQYTQGYCSPNSFSATTNQITTAGFTYDASGDLTNDGTHTYAYDAEGRLASVDDGSTANYAYNALGQRTENVAKAVWWVYNPSGDIMGIREPSTWDEDYIDFQGRHLAHYQNSEAYFMHVNNVDTTSIVTDYTGTVQQDELHYPWGQEWTMMGSMQEERFAKLQHRDTETGLDPTHFRMYSSDLGRWQSPDSLHGQVSNPQTLDRYAYVLGNPANRIDPRGLCGCYPGYDEFDYLYDFGFVPVYGSDCGCGPSGCGFPFPSIYVTVHGGGGGGGVQVGGVYSPSTPIDYVGRVAVGSTSSGCDEWARFNCGLCVDACRAQYDVLRTLHTLLCTRGPYGSAACYSAYKRDQQFLGSCIANCARTPACRACGSAMPF